MWEMTLTNRTPQWIELDGAVNARAVVPGVLLRSDNLQGLSNADVRTLVDEHGVELVLDLRTGVEVRMEHRSLYPEKGNTDLDIDTVIPWGTEHDESLVDEVPTVRAYMGYLGRRPDSVAESVRAIAHTEGAVLVHCAAGKDRTGVVVAIALDAAGWDRQVVVDDYMASNDRIEQIFQRLRSSETYRAELEGHVASQHAPVPGAIERVLELVDAEYGSSVAFLLENGLDESDIAALRERLGSSATSQ
jgi:protein-tyrosine phosphatase